MSDKLHYTLLGNKVNSIIDSIFLWADVVLECVRQSVDRNISSLQGWLFIQNQKLHGIDVSSFCNSDGDEEKEEV